MIPKIKTVLSYMKITRGEIMLATWHLTTSVWMLLFTVTVLTSIIGAVAVFLFGNTALAAQVSAAYLTGAVIIAGIGIYRAGRDEVRHVLEDAEPTPPDVSSQLEQIKLTLEEIRIRVMS